MPNDPGPVLVYLGQGTPIVDATGNPAFDATGNATHEAVNHAPQAMIDTNFTHERNYWQSFQNVKRACYNVLNQNIDDAFTSPDEIS
jgi:hypothetical protein